MDCDTLALPGTGRRGPVLSCPSLAHTAMLPPGKAFFNGPGKELPIGNTELFGPMIIFYNKAVFYVIRCSYLLQANNDQSFDLVLLKGAYMNFLSTAG